MLGKITGGLKGVGGMAGLAGKAIGMAFRVGPLLAVTAAIAATVAIFKKFKQEQEQNRIEQTNSIAITEKSAAEAGIKYNNLSESIKNVNQQLELTRAKGRNAYEALNSSGVQGLTLSIKELRENIKNAKENQKELVATFSNIDVSGDVNKQAKVTEVATNLKAQFVAAGMTAQEATNKIYSIIAASDKAGMAFNAISGKGFREIVDASSAADAMIVKLNSNMDKVSGKDLGESLSNIVTTLDVGLAKLMKTKKANGEVMTQQEAMAEILDEINLKKGSEATLTKNQVNSLKESHPELAAILNETDNVAGVYAKWRVLLSGVRVDLKNISSDQAQTIAAFEAQIDSAIAKSETAVGGGTGIMASSQKAIAALQKQIAAGGQKAAMAAQKTQDQIKEEIKLIDKKIDKINEEAEARKKALEANQSKENLALEIQKAQLEYADKVAAGDMAGAAQAQLKVKQLIGERENQKAIDAIEENRAKREKELIAQREKLQAQSDKAASNLTAAQNNAAVSTTRMNKIDQYQNEYERLVKESINIQAMKTDTAAEKKAKTQAETELRGSLGDLSKLISGDVKGSDKVLATQLKNIFGGKLINKETGESMAGYVRGGTHPKSTASSYVARGADTALAQDAKAVLNMAESIKGGATLQDVVNAVKGDKGTQVYGTKKTAKQIEDNAYDKYIQKDGSLNAQGRRAIMVANKLGAGQYFTYEGKTYKGQSGGANDFLPAVLQKAGGGTITGPGTGTSDSIPAYLSNGEFVVNAKSAAAFGYGNLETINKMAAGGLATKFDVPAYAMGGRIKYDAGGMAVAGSNVTINATLNFAEAPKNGRELWREFKNMARAEGAKIGENIVMGGSY
jgi:predicted Fe-Mo cluster-binding NifX family protein